MKKEIHLCFCDLLFPSSGSVKKKERFVASNFKRSEETVKFFFFTLKINSRNFFFPYH